jgi:asparagine synthase (glutamine-hydrolysing)
MCGICGILGFDGPSSSDRSQERVDAMLEALRHRGPNAIGSAVSGPIVIGATRLAVRGIDHPSQPSIDRDSGVVVVCNGEIDNHRELRQWLEARGRSVPPGSDVEVLPGMYLELGDEFLDRLVGAFALAVWDPRHGRLLLARDRTGERPLFLRRDTRGLTFASEIAALAASGSGPLTVSDIGIRSYLQFGNFAAPRSPFNEIEKIGPGERVVVDRGTVSRHRYWRWSLGQQQKRPASIDGFDTVFREAVRRQTDVDIDFAVFLSGGLDSSLVTAVTRSLHPSKPLVGYTVRFGEASFDEGDVAQEVAHRLGVRPESIWVGPEDFARELPLLVRRVGEPLADPAWLPAALLSRTAAQSFRMTLVGEGADELFGGYPTYLGVRAAETYNRLPGPVRSLFRRAVEALPPSDKKVTLSFLLKRFVSGADLDGITRHQIWNSNIPPTLLRRLGIDPVPLPGPIPEGPELLDRVQQLDLETSLAEGLLTKADRAGMSSALELRAPFLDLGVLDYASTLQSSDRVRGLTTKKFLKAYALRYLPHSIVHRRKRGLSVPLATWLRGPLRNWAADRLSDSALESVGVSRKAAQSVFEEHLQRRADHGRALWTLIVLSFWLEWARSPSAQGEPS